MSAQLRGQATAIARRNGHDMQQWRPVPHVGTGDVYYGQCKLCGASLIWRSRHSLMVPSVEGSALFQKCKIHAARNKRNTR